MSDLNGRQEDKVVRFNRGFSVNIGIVLAVIVILYMGFHVFSSLTKKEVVAYQVNLGTIVEKNFYQGLALRQEEIVYTDRPGTVYYYEKNKSRVGVKSRVYAVDADGNIIRQFLNSNDGYRTLGAEDLNGIYPTVDSFVGNFSGVNFITTYSFKNDVNDYLSETRARGLVSQYAGQIEQARQNGTFFDYYAREPGFLVYALDGYENKTLEEVSAEDFRAGVVTQANLRSNEDKDAGEPVYKLVTNDDWQIVIPIDAAKATQLGEMGSIKLRFTQDNTNTWAASQVVDMEGSKYLVLSLDDSMERYADQRFINVELLLDETKGLKITNSALVEKEFFVIPKSYFFAGGNSQDLGIMVRKEGAPDSFVIPTIYYETEDEYYIDSEYVSGEDLLVMENSKTTMVVGENTTTLTGVYNINKGYAAFRRVDITFQNDDYTIVRNQASYSIALYDHIVLDASGVKENEIV